CVDAGQGGEITSSGICLGPRIENSQLSQWLTGLTGNAASTSLGIFLLLILVSLPWSNLFALPSIAYAVMRFITGQRLQKSWGMVADGDNFASLVGAKVR